MPRAKKRKPYVVVIMGGERNRHVIVRRRTELGAKHAARRQLGIPLKIWNGLTVKAATRDEIVRDRAQRIDPPIVKCSRCKMQASKREAVLFVGGQGNRCPACRHHLERISR